MRRVVKSESFEFIRLKQGTPRADLAHGARTGQGGVISHLRPIAEVHDWGGVFP